MFLGGYDFSLDRLDKTELCYGNGAGRKESMKVEDMQVKSGKDMEKMDMCMKTLVEMGVTADADDRRCRSFPLQRSLPATLKCGMPGEWEYSRQMRGVVQRANGESPRWWHAAPDRRTGRFVNRGGHLDHAVVKSVADKCEKSRRGKGTENC
jgi:hypothetical protein